MGPSDVTGEAVTGLPHNSTDVQFAAGMAGGSKGYGWMSGTSAENASSLEGGSHKKGKKNHSVKSRSRNIA